MQTLHLALRPDAAAPPQAVGVIALDLQNRARVVKALLQGADPGLGQLVAEINAAPLELPDPTIGAPNMPMTGIMTFEPHEPEFPEALRLWLELRGFIVTLETEPTSP